MPRLTAVVPRYEGGISTEHGSALPRNGKFISITNSQRVLAACPKRWWFRYAERLDTEAGPAARLGTAFHEVMEDIWGWWSKENSTYPKWALKDQCIWCFSLRSSAPTWAEESDCVCDVCKAGPTSSLGFGPVAKISDKWRSFLVDCDEPIMLENEFDVLIETLLKMVEGYLERWGYEPPEGFDVVGVEVTLAAPIMDGEKSFKTNVPVIQDENEIRIASRLDVREGFEPKMVRWPWYQVGRVDGLLRHQKTGSLWILEHKTSKSPKTYFDSLSIDPQTTGYIWLLRSMCRAGLFGEELKNHPNPVAGYLYDVVSSVKQYAPAKLKSGEYSKAKNRNTPSWIYQETINASLSPEDAALYDDHIQYLEESIDPKLYQREWGSVGSIELERYDSEILGVAERHAKMMRDQLSQKDQSRLFPRQPVCMRGFCSYKGICVNDTPEGRTRYVKGRIQKWKLKGVGNDPDTGNTKQADNLPF